MHIWYSSPLIKILNGALFSKDKMQTPEYYQQGPFFPLQLISHLS